MKYQPFLCNIDHKIKNIDQNGNYRPMVDNIDPLAALYDPKENMRRYNLHAEVERTGSDLKGDGVDVVMKGTEQAVKKMDKLLRELTSTYLVMPLKQSEQSVLTRGEGLLLEQIRRRTGAAIGFKDGKLYIFGQEKERLEAKAVVKQELKLCTSSPWRRWSFLRKSSVVG